MKKILLVLLFLNLPFLLYGIKTPQKNPEELFVADHALKSLKADQENFHSSELIFVTNFKNEELEKLKDFFDSKDLSFSSLAPIIRDLGILELPSLGDEKKLKVINEITTNFPNLELAGDAFTNAELALMTLHIQEVIFPVIFGVIFLGLFLVLKNFEYTLFLFLTSLLGASQGLFWVKFLYQHSTILTTLTPLIGFVLTLGVQFHVLYGLNTFVTREKFYHHKLKPILLMMITTIIGFLSLLSSNLESIRQFSTTASLTLTVTWIILLSLNHFWSPQITFSPVQKIHLTSISPKVSRYWGYLFLFLLLGGGILALRNMNILVDAVQFFPETHPVKIGHQEVLKKIGGVPEFEIILQKQDNSPLIFSDYSEIEKVESYLKENEQKNFLGLVELTKKINFIYSGEAKLPDNEFALEALQSQIPYGLKSNLKSEKNYKLIYLAKDLSTENREKISRDIIKKLNNSFPQFKFHLSGLRHFLLESQKNLVLSLIQSFILSFIFISIIFGFTSRKAKSIFIFCLINSASVLGGIFLMWVFGMTLNISTVMTVSISMGLVVDSTIHLLHSEQLNEGNDSKYKSTLLPIILSHVVLFMAFGILSFEKFLPISDFAKGLLILLILGLFCDLFILPMINKTEEA